MVAILAFALFAFAGFVAFGVIAATVAPYRAQIACLLVHGTQTRIAALPPLPSRGETRATPRLTASPAHLRAAA
ncbi:MAG TPA: hypothetical protein DEP91_10175 [Sphingomonas bacterium]|uniref:Uncharacterized protein n=1 Tax=Sphingomonas bacterium TaxID=1895847 RepID=A0A3D0WCS2_9SPHN|nr:hypothetical protein [Sphingomonas bacterium]